MKSGADTSAAAVRADVLVLLREKRYEELLTLLYKARTESPNSVEIQKSITQVKAFLVGAYAERLGGLDQVPTPLPTTAGRSPDVVLLSRYIDGASTYGDIAHVCPLGRIETLQLLVELYANERGAEDQSTSDVKGPSSRERLLEEELDSSLAEHEERDPETARSIAPSPMPAINDPVERQYREAFAEGTAAYVQGRYADAVSAFEACAQLRVGDARAEVMLRRSRRELGSNR